MSRRASPFTRFRAWVEVVAPMRWIVVAVPWLVITQIPNVVARFWHEQAGFEGGIIGLFLASLFGFAGAYGATRVMTHHPAMNADYHDWLTSTPWNAAKDLPLRPPWLIAQDAVVVSALNVLCWPILLPTAKFLWQIEMTFNAGLVLLLPTIVALASYVGALLLALAVSGEFAFVYGAFFVGAGAVACRDSVPLALGLAFLFVVVTQIGARASLRGFPYSGRLIRDAMESANERAVNQAAFPWEILSPVVAEEGLAWRDAVLLPALAAAWFFALSSPNPEPVDLLMAQIFVVGAPLVYRLYHYCWGYWPPISLAGRFATRRWIIGGYDQVFLGPLAALLLGFWGTGQFVALGATPALDRAVIVGVQLLCLTTIGPRHRDWLLTGKFRAEPVRTTSAVVRL